MADLAKWQSDDTSIGPTHSRFLLRHPQNACRQPLVERLQYR